MSHFGSGQGNGTPVGTIRRPLDDLLPGQKGARQTGQVRQPPGRLLVIDDSKAAREDLIALLQSKGHSVLTANNGLEGLRCWIGILRLS